MAKKTEKEKETAVMKETAEDTAEDTAVEAVEGTEQETEQTSGQDATAETDTDTKAGEEDKGEDNSSDPRDAKIADLTDRLQRSMAEFENYRKRTEKEKSSMYVIGAKEIIEKILPVVDNFERGLDGLSEEQMKEPFAEGMEKTYRQLMTAFDDLGVKVIPTVGESFDPNFHNAVMHVDDEAEKDNIVVEEFQKGYTYKGFVVRHSMVKVAN